MCLTSHHFDHSNVSLAFMVKSDRPYGLTIEQAS